MIGDHFASGKPIDPGENLIRNTYGDFINGWLQPRLYYSISRSGSQSASIEWFNSLNSRCPLVPVLDVRKNLPHSARGRLSDELFCRSHVFSRSSDLLTRTLIVLINECNQIREDSQMDAFESKL